ncbi:hypothetical protein COR50_05840 [Chitinophaga caeni]|uniref:Uncharacterized protein n=1 Tax=Chitinophaga caeni TaxID=2029983 RepID=A0A291QS67_9BACT|nr:hypothetical protein [Chitinophaga caeni]ATL46732.1 hypothetical protein COR50_05840 [Chitinophaga caeni]
MEASKKVNWDDERKAYLWLAIVGAIITIAFYFIPRNLEGNHGNELVVLHKLIVEKAPEIKMGRRGNKRRIILHIQAYNKPFQIAGFNFSELIKQEILDSIKLGDTINVKIDSLEFANINKARLFDDYVEIKSLTKGEREYLSIQRAKSEMKNDLKLGTLLGIYLMVSGLIFWSYKSKPQVSPKIIISVGLLLLLILAKR